MTNHLASICVSQSSKPPPALFRILDFKKSFGFLPLLLVFALFFCSQAANAQWSIPDGTNGAHGTAPSPFAACQIAYNEVNTGDESTGVGPIVEVVSVYPDGYNSNPPYGPEVACIGYATYPSPQVPGNGSNGLPFYTSPLSSTVTCSSGLVGDGNSPGGCSPANGVQPPKNTGKNTCGCDGPDGQGAKSTADPIDIASGNVTYETTDYTTAGANPLAFTRYYNSRTNFSGILGQNWRSPYDRHIYLVSSSSVIVERANGQQFNFTLTSGTWTTDTDVDYTLTNSGSTWTLHGPDDVVETYTAYATNANIGGQVLLNSIAARNGYTQTLSYSGTQITSVHDSYSRTFSFAYNSNGTLASVTSPDSTTITFGYTTTNSLSNLTSVTYPTSPASTVTYVYGNSSLYSALTSVVDENGNTYSTWTYDAYGRGLTSKLGSGANLTTVSYNDTSVTRTVTNALGVTDTYSFTMLQSVPKITGISRAATGTTAAATESFTYDSNGYLASRTDWNGNTTTYTNNAHGLPTQIVEASGSTVARTTTVAYDATWVHLPDSITTPGLTTSFTYDASGEVLTRTLTDTTTTSVPYSTGGQTRTWTNTWSNHLLATAKSPNSNTTTFGYNTSGALTSITNALGQVTNITSVTAGGRPLTIVDPNGATNGITTTLTYNARQWLTSKALSTSAGTHTTTYTYDLAGNLTKTTLPDSAYIAMTYDTAHRVTKLTDALGDYIAITLNALGDKTQINTYDNGSTLWRQHSATFDALGRMLVDTGGVSGENTTYVYDKNNNVTSIKDGNNNLLLQAFDALNRVTTRTNANASISGFNYDAHDRILSQWDYNGNTTTFVRNGFGDAIEQASPDSGTTTYRYDADANLTQWVPAAGNGANLAYDALDRIVSKQFPSDSSENVFYAYDQPNTYPYSANEIGRLSYMSDVIGTVFFAYDTYGNVSHRERVNTSYTDLNDIWMTYDAANRPLGVAYPSGLGVAWNRDAAGNIDQVTMNLPGGGAGQTVEWVAHDAFYGPVHYESFGNGVSDAIWLDLDYRRTASQIFTNSGNLSYQSYTYDNASNLTGISDSANAALSQTLGYDVLNRLTSAVSGTGGYGTLAWAYDSNGNLTSRTAGGTSYSYGYTSGSNRLSTVTWPSNSETMGYTANGNISSMTLNGAAAFTGTYNLGNRLTAVANTPTALSSIVYDGNGLRYSKTDSGGSPITFVYDLQGNLIEENNGGTVKDYIYMDGKLSGIWLPASSTLYYVAGDPRGAPLYVTNSSQATVWSTSYQPYGTTGTITGSVTQNIRLPGQYYDSETTLNYNGFRDYVPNWGRYLEADPIGLAGGLNPYRYANANPFGYTDSSGRDSVSTSGSDSNSSGGQTNACGSDTPNLWKAFFFGYNGSWGFFQPMAIFAGIATLPVGGTAEVVADAGAGATEGATVEGQTLYRGVSSDSPAYNDALNGAATPRGTSTDVYAHITGDTENSGFTSWTSNSETASTYATQGGGTQE